MHVRHATPDDRDAVVDVVCRAFDEPREGRVHRLLDALDASQQVLASLVADDDGVVGHVQLNRGWVDAREALVDVAVLSPLSVAPDRQRSGVGTRLLAAALETAGTLGAPAVFLEGGWDYYGRRGFSQASPLGFVAPSPRIPDRAFQVALLKAYEPWMVGALVYPDAFWLTDTVGLRDPLLSEIEARADGT